jgi:hypothetical protein
MVFYSFDEIRDKADCRIIASDLLHVTIADGRCAATWRGGKNKESVAVNKADWYDHAKKEGGGPLQLAAIAFSGNIQQAQEWCGNRFGCAPKNKTVASPKTHESRFDKLIADGYAEVSRYEYRDLAGTVRHITVRLEKDGTPGKEFVQGVPSPDGTIRWGLKGVETFLYRLPEISGSDWVLLCEGEKSANYMASLDLPATTSPMGAGKWQDSYTASLAGKHVAIAADNDAPGREHAEHVANALHGHAASIRVIPPQLPDEPKSGIDDWACSGFPPKEAQDVIDLIQRTRQWQPATSGSEAAGQDTPTAERLADAKQANTEPFRNFVPSETEKTVRGKPVKEITKDPRCQNDMIQDLHRRFLGFPRLDGGCLFDHDRDTGRIVKISKSSDLISWIDRKSKRPVGWARGDSLCTKDEFLSSLFATARRYEGVSYTPDWPPRQDLYYAHDPMPAPCPELSRLRQLISMFSPASDEDRHLITALIASPLWHIPGIPRPSWIIDSQDGAGSGKTVLVELIAQLYASDPIRTNPEEIHHDIQELIKRLLSSDGRTGRIVLIDNVTGEFRAPGLADLITARSISGRAPYGHGEEKRPNNLVYVLTANSAQVDHDIAIRSFYIVLKRPTYASGWLSAAQSYIAANRLAIISDIIHLLSHHDPFQTTTSTRFPEFETSVLQACCRTPEAYADVVARVSRTRAESNTDGLTASAIREVFQQRIRDLGIDSSTPVFIRSEVVNSWAGKPIRDIQEWRPKPIQLVRNLAKLRMIPEIDPSVSRWPRHHHDRLFSGLAWNFTPSTVLATVVHGGDGGHTSLTHE